MRFILTSFSYLPSRGGVARHVNELARAFVKLGNEVTIVTAKTNNIPEYKYHEGIEEYRVSSHGLKFFEISKILSFSLNADEKIRNIIKRGDVDGVQFHGISGIATIVRGGMYVPIVTKVHGTWYADISLIKKVCSNEDAIEGGTKTKVGRCLAHLTVKSADKICFGLSPHLVTNSNSVKSDLKKYYNIPLEKISVVYNGVNHELFNPNVDGDQTKRNLGLNSRIVLYVGDFSSLKGVHLLPHIARMVSKKIKNVTFILVGGYLERVSPAIKAAFARSGVKDYVRIISYVPYKELPNYYSMADLVIVPSLHEGFGNVALEAMASGKPVVAFNTGGLSEFVNDSVGLVADPGDITSFADAVTELLISEDSRIEKGKRAYELSLGFSWEKTAQKTIEIFKMLMS